MRFAIIENNKVINIVEASSMFAKKANVINVTNIPASIGDDFINGVFEKTLDDGTIIEINPEVIDNITPKEKREHEYMTTLIIDWQGKMITVDQANLVYLQYLAEGNQKAAEIQTLIVQAKNYIREQYPDEKA